jgi:3D-(3,5/4)-trihydroxycyclohexane-1,2-dione acylhydrolase (decyclizing)
MTSATIRLTAAQALVRAMAAQRTSLDGETVPLFGRRLGDLRPRQCRRPWRGSVGVRDVLPTFRAHNEQAMAHAAIAYAKAMRRRRMMACTTSIGPGATNMVTAAAVAHVNRLPCCCCRATCSPTATRPVLQQVEDFRRRHRRANDCFRPVSRYFDRITRPEQIISALARAMPC